MTSYTGSDPPPPYLPSQNSASFVNPAFLEDTPSSAPKPPPYEAVSSPGSPLPSLGPPPIPTQYLNVTPNHQLYRDFLAHTNRSVPRVYQEGARHSMSTVFWHLLLACVVMWLCGFCFGAVAVGLAVMAGRKSQRGDTEGGQKLALMSLFASLVGIFIGVFLWSTVIVLLFVRL